MRFLIIGFGTTFAIGSGWTARVSAWGACVQTMGSVALAKVVRWWTGTVWVRRAVSQGDLGFIIGRLRGIGHILKENTTISSSEWYVPIVVRSQTHYGSDGAPGESDRKANINPRGSRHASDVASSTDTVQYTPAIGSLSW